MNTKKMATAGLLKLLGLLLDKQLLEHIKTLVLAEWFTDATGTEKRAKVDAALRDVKGDLKEILAKAGTSLINTAIEIVVLYFNARQSELSLSHS